MNARREGFTLVELLVVSVIGAIILASVYQTLTVQERASRQSYAIIGTQQNTRIALEVLTSELRELSATDGDITRADSISIDVRALRKGGVVCNRDAALSLWIDVAEIGTPFVSTDSIVAYSDGANANSWRDDSWIRRRPSSVGAGACAGNPISANIRRLTSLVAWTNVIPGALVRSYVPVRFRLVQVGAKGVITRVEGADSVVLIEDLSNITNQGLRFRYWDSLGVAMPYNTLNANLNRISRIQVKVRGTAIGGLSGANREFTDSLVSTIFLRGNQKLR